MSGDRAVKVPAEPCVRYQSRMTAFEADALLSLTVTLTIGDSPEVVVTLLKTGADWSSNEAEVSYAPMSGVVERLPLAPVMSVVMFGYVIGVPLFAAGVAPPNVRSVVLIKFGSAFALPWPRPFDGAAPLIAAAQSSKLVRSDV